jgi:hypothetical protein
MTLTGPRWADLLLQLIDSAVIAEQAAFENGESAPESAAYRGLVDVISVRLGGPRHPDLG